LTYNTTFSLVDRIRRKINDTSSTPTYDDFDIIDYLTDAIEEVGTETGTEYTIDTDGTISPSVTLPVALLFVLKTSINILTKEAMEAAQQAIKVKSGANSVDYTKRASEKRELLSLYKIQYNNQMVKVKSGLPATKSLVTSRFMIYD